MKYLTNVVISQQKNERNKAPQWVRADEFKQRDPSFVASSHAHRMATVGEMAAGMAHDFRNVLQTLSSTLELIDTLHTDPEAVRRLASSGLRTIERGAGLAQRFLALCRHEKSHICTVSDVLPSILDVAETLACTIGARVKLNVEQPATEVWPTVIDSNEFELALLNLGINARDAMPDGGAILFRIKNITLPQADRRQLMHMPEQERRGPPLRLPGGDYVSISVSDTGLGMDTVTLSQAIQPFFTTKPRNEGTGLGLPIVHSFATRYGGGLRLISKPNAGTTVEIWLPRAITSDTCLG